MAEGSAASAAPSTSAPPAQPSPDAAAPDPSLSPVRDAPPPEAGQRLAKPIRPIPQLPGVFPDDDPFPAAPSPRAPSSENAKTAPARGPDGRFLPPAGEHTLEPTSQRDEPPTDRFKFAGEEFDSQEAAEQNVRTLRGQFKPLMSLAKSVGGVDKILPSYAQAAESARGWKAEHDRVKAELDAQRGVWTADGSRTAAEAPQDLADSGTDVPGVDWELYAEIKKLADESGTPGKADQWLSKQNEMVLQARLDRMLTERLAPFTEAQEHAGRAAQTENLFGSLAEYTHPDGSTAFPELHDETSAYEIGKLWASLGLPPESALTPQGAIAAIAIYRMAHGSQAGSAAAAPPAPATPRQPTDVDAAAGLDDGKRVVASVAGNGSPSAEAAHILAGLRQANQGGRASLLGFDA